MNNSAFASIAPDIFKWGETLSENERIEIARAVARWACDRARVENPVSVLSSTDRAFLAELSRDYDERYFSIYEANDEQFDEAGLALLWFTRARAVLAVSDSLDAADKKYFFSTLNEAQAAVGGVDELRAFLRHWMPDAA